MKTLILHLSDIHFSKLRGTINAEPLVKACAKGTKPDNVILVFSGDFVDRPHRKNFEAFEFLFDNLKCRISEAFGLKSIDVVVTPGNHDIPLSGSDSISQTELVDNPASKRKNFERAVKSESDALAFCEKNGCSFIDGAIGEKNIEFQNVSIHFVMINSAPFSSVKYDDKEHHYLPDSCALIGRPSSTKKNIEILVSHHRPDWFDYDSSAKMVKFIEETATICLFGHEHDAKCYAQISDEDNVVISKGGRLRVINNTLTGSFSKLLIDDEKEEVTVEALTFNQTFGQFCSEPCHSYHLRLNDTKRLRDEFVNGVLNPQVVGKIHESDVFVMPLLRANGDQDDIGTLDSLVAFCLKEENCYLHGFHNCGKSSLLHRLFDAIRPKAWVVFLECGEYLTSNPEKAIKNAYEAQYYYSDFNYRDFYEAPREEKVIIVDAFEELRGEAAKDKYRDYFSKTFGSVVMAVSNSSYNAKVGLSVSCYEPDFSFEISGFSLKKRRELYAKIASMYGIIIDSDLDLISNCIEAALGLGSVIDISDPAFLVDIASCIIKDKYYLERDTRNDFSEAFQHSINAALTEVIKTAQLDDYYLLLSQLAADMAFVYKDRCFDAAQLQKAINERKERFAIKFEPFNEILENLLKSGLIASEKDKYRFERNSLNAFFAAKEVVRLYQKGDKSYLDIATEDITYGIYGDIVMFAAYQLQRVDVFFKMQDILEKGFKDIEEISYDKKNNEILRKNTRLIPETVEQAENRKQLYERLDKSERKAIAEAPKEERSAYEKSEVNDWMKAITKSLKLLEISSKAIAGFKTEIEAGDRELLLETTVSSALRLVNFMYRFTPEDIDFAEKDFQKWKNDKIERMQKENKSANEISKIEEETLTHLFYDHLTTMVLNLMTSLARLMTSKTSIPFIENMSADDSFRKLFVVIAYGEYGSNTKFLSYFSKIIGGTKDLGFKLILKRVARVFVITHSLSVTEMNQLAIACGYPRDKFYLYSKPFERK